MTDETIEQSLIDVVAKLNELKDYLSKRLHSVDLALSNLGQLNTRHMAGRNHVGGLILSVKSAVEKMTGEFTVHDICSATGDRRAGSISTSLRRLCEEGTVDVVSRGRGRMPGRYKLKPQAEARP